MKVNKIGILIDYNDYLIESCIEIHNKERTHYFTRYISDIVFGIAMNKYLK